MKMAAAWAPGAADIADYLALNNRFSVPDDDAVQMGVKSRGPVRVVYFYKFSVTAVPAPCVGSTYYSGRWSVNGSAAGIGKVNGIVGVKPLRFSAA